MKNNSEIVNNTMCKSCLREHKEMTGYEPIDCAFKAFDNEYCEEAQKLTDYITKQDNKWQKLKEWVSFTQPKNINDEFICGACSAYSNVIDKMQELEGEDE